MKSTPKASPALRPRSAATWLKRWLALGAFVLLLDQASKELIERLFSFGERLPVLTGFFDLTLVYNRGAAFSFLAGASGWQRWFFTVLGLVAAVVIIWLLRRHATQKLFSLGLALILGGALGNVIDRVVRGHVVDFLLVYWRDYYFPAFNIADSAITVGAALLIVDEFRRIRQAKRGG
ncbi:MAG: lipoprotein signal peptidase [Burkholderiales bacterium]|nr:lipoprotein signal peptidase [Burkholderiales bacterium]